MKSRIKHMVKHRYLPFSTGKKVRGGAKRGGGGGGGGGGGWSGAVLVGGAGGGAGSGASAAGVSERPRSGSQQQLPDVSAISAPPPLPAASAV
jgi:hypothetical protein